MPESTPIIRRRNTDLTQRALLEAAARLFAVRGYEAVTLENIAAEAGVTKAMVRYHFEDKAGMYRAVVTESLDHVAAAIAEVRDAPLEPQVKLARYVATLAQGIRDRPHLGVILMSDYAAGRIAGDAALTSSLMRLSATTRGVIGEGIRAGAFAKVDPHLFHLWLVGAIALFVSSQRFRDEVGTTPPWKGPAPDFRKFVAMLQRFALRGVARDT